MIGVADSRPRPALFLHIQKTAGSAIVDAARRRYGDDLTRHADCWHLDPKRFAHVGFVSGHFGYDFARSLMPGRYCFTFLREPRERILSMYYFCRSRNPAQFVIYERANAMDLVQFLEAGFTDPWVRKNIWNNQTWQLCHGYSHLDDRTLEDFSPGEMLAGAWQHLQEFNHVGFTETLAADTRIVFRELALELEAPARVNVTGERPGLGDVGARERRLLDELTGLDRELYARAMERHRAPDGGRTAWPG